MNHGIRFALAAFAVGTLMAATVQDPAPAWSNATRADLCVTEGSVAETADHRLSVDSPKMRAYFNRWSAQEIEARFTYLGPATRQAPLGSGEIRRQFGLKLQAQDACNLVYAMWRFTPQSQVVVSVKSNPGEHTSSECGNRGYRNIKPRESSPAPFLNAGDTHSFRAAINRQELKVWIDGAAVWTGNLGSEARSLRGPVGIRSDNARLKIELHTAQPTGAHPDYVVACQSGAGESE